MIRKSNIGPGAVELQPGDKIERGGPSGGPLAQITSGYGGFLGLERPSLKESDALKPPKHGSDTRSDQRRRAVVRALLDLPGPEAVGN